MTDRDPHANPTPLDRASFYVEQVFFGDPEGRLMGYELDQYSGHIAEILMAAGVTSMSARELTEAMLYYANSFAESMHIPVNMALSIFSDGILHGLALGAGLEGPARNPKGS